MNQRTGAVRRPLASSPFTSRQHAARVQERLEVADRVLHDRHGLGKVVAVEDTATVQVDFGSGGLRRVRAANLTML